MPYKEYKPEKLYYSIGEVAEILGESTSLVRFWSDTFSDFVRPERNRKGNRRFTPADVENLKIIHHLVKEGEAPTPKERHEKQEEVKAAFAQEERLHKHEE